MEVDGRLRDSELKTVSVGGVARLDGKVQHGFRGCVQVGALISPLAHSEDSTETFTNVVHPNGRRSLQGLRVGSALSLSQARKVNVEPGCVVPDPCSSSPCPTSSYCSDDWDSYSCTCLTGQRSVISG